MKRDLIFLDQYTTEFKGEKYENYKFWDPITLRIFFGTNLTVGELEKGKTYKGTLVVRSFKGEDRIKVDSIEK